MRNWLASQRSIGIDQVTMADVASGIGLTQHGDGGATVPLNETKRIARAMERAGYEPTRTRIDGHQVRCVAGEAVSAVAPTGYSLLSRAVTSCAGTPSPDPSSH